MNFNASNTLGADFETYSDVDIANGLDNYFNAPNFQPVILRVARYGPSGVYFDGVDFTQNMERGRQEAIKLLNDKAWIAAHNAPFEIGVCNWLGITDQILSFRFVDTAALSRLAGAESSLRFAAPQLLGLDKIALGEELIQLFAIPQPGQVDPAFDVNLIDLHKAKWQQYINYCNIDAKLSLDLALKYGHLWTMKEHQYSMITHTMNQRGWTVDTDLLHRMEQRYEKNLENIEPEFIRRFDNDRQLLGIKVKGIKDLFDPADAQTIETYEAEGREVKAVYDEPINLGSWKQVLAFAKKNGFPLADTQEATLLKAQEKLAELVPLVGDPVKKKGYEAVQALIAAKLEIGGASLKKLVKVRDSVGADHKLRNQYRHIGAGQTARTSGMGVQMQNLRRFQGEPDDVSDIRTWDNHKLSINMRQLFTSSYPRGQLIVGDFSSVEARSLALIAGAEWKLEAFRAGQDLYKVFAARVYGCGYDGVTKDQRQFGKIGELSGGYQSGGQAVKDFAEKMGVYLTLAEAQQVNDDYREMNPEIVKLWEQLNEMLHDCVNIHRSNGYSRVLDLPHDKMQIRMMKTRAPQSLLDQEPGKNLCSISVAMFQDGDLVFERWIHGCYLEISGTWANVVHYKPTALVTGDLWKNYYLDPKTDKQVKYTMYGGKLTGIINQSFCRELFFSALRATDEWAGYIENLDLIGQFHDEIVMDWWPKPGGISLDEAKRKLERIMSDPHPFKTMPLEAEIKSDYRYTK